MLAKTGGSLSLVAVSGMSDSGIHLLRPPAPPRGAASPAGANVSPLPSLCHHSCTPQAQAEQQCSNAGGGALFAGSSLLPLNRAARPDDSSMPHSV